MKKLGLSISINYLESVVKIDIPRLDTQVKKQVQKAIESKLVSDPIKFGKPLQYNLKHCRSLRVGDYRVIYQVEDTIVVIVKIGHRKEVYGRI